MKLFIAEKPSMARMIAAAFGDCKTESAGKIKNYICDGGAVKIVPSAGHILELYKMEDYDPKYKVWADGDYPFKPDVWKYKKKPDAIDLLNNIERSLKEADSVVNAGDADREGQLLVDEILEYFKYKGAAERLLITDTNPEAIRKAIAGMKSNREYAGLSLAGKAHAIADWMLGMNMSRVCALKAQAGGFRGSLSVGRVQTPLVGLVVRRDAEIANFTPRDYFTPFVTFEAPDGTRFSCRWSPGEAQQGMDEDGRLVDDAARTALEQKLTLAITRGERAQVKNIEKKPKKSAPPMPHSLPTLQIKANEKLSLSAKEVLEKVQDMYERGIVTYPRSDCEYLPESVRADAERIISGVAKLRVNLSRVTGGCDFSIKSAAFNDKKVAEHYAIIPTGKAGDLDDVQGKLYDLLATRFALQFWGPHEYLETKGEIAFAGETFIVTGRETIADGWRAVYEDDVEKKTTIKEENDEDATSSSKLPALDKGAEIAASALDMRARQTKPPKPFTEATLLKAMNGIHNYVTAPEIKRVLKENDGLGTAATQAGHIDNILKKEYVERDGKKIVSTQKGRDLIAALPSELTSPDRTALWEMEVKRIADGGMTLGAFVDDVFGELKKLTERVRGSGSFKIAGSSASLLAGDPKFPCFKCRSPMRRIARRDGSGHFWLCTGTDCGLILSDDGGRPQKARKCPKCGDVQKLLTSKAGKKFWKCAGANCGNVDFIEGKASKK